MELTIELEIKCDDCDGYGNGWRGVACSTCHGTGMIPTEAGKTLIEFLKKYKSEKE